MFGHLLARYRAKGNWTAEAFSDAIGLSVADVLGMEHGVYCPTLVDLFRIARAVGEEPCIFLVELMKAWRGDSTDTLYASRSTDFERLFRLGYLQKPGDFRELNSTYDSAEASMHAATKLNAQRLTRGVALLDTLSIYVRLASLNLKAGTR